MVTLDFSILAFNELRKAMEVSENWLQQRTTAQSNSIERIPAGISADEWDELRTAREYEQWVVRERLPTLVRRGFFLSIYALTEERLNDICEAARQACNASQGVTDLRGHGIKRAKHYLSTVIQVRYPWGSSCEWQALTQYNGLRNVFAHGEGRLVKGDATSQKVESFVRGHALLDVDRDGTITIERDFCREVVDTAVTFLSTLRGVTPLPPPRRLGKPPRRS